MIIENKHIPVMAASIKQLGELIPVLEEIGCVGEEHLATGLQWLLAVLVEGETHTDSPENTLAKSVIHPPESFELDKPENTP